MDIANEVLIYTKTNMSPLEIISIVNKVIQIKDYDIEQVEFPFEEARNGCVYSENSLITQLG